MFETIEPGHDRRCCRVDVGTNQLDERNFEVDPWVQRVAHRNTRFAQNLDRSHNERRAHSLSKFSGPGRRSGQTRCHQRQETLSQHADEVSDNLTRVSPLVDDGTDCTQRTCGVAGCYRADDFFKVAGCLIEVTEGGNLVEGRQCITERAISLAGYLSDGVRIQFDSSIGCDPLQMIGERVERSEAELKVLGTADNGGKHLLRVGRGKHKHHMRWRLFERLQERIGSSGRQHVDLVDDVHLAPTCGSERCAADQISHGVDSVVGSRIEFNDVHRRARNNLYTTVALAARFAVLDVGAVERLGQDACRRGLASAARTREQVGVKHRIVADRIA